MTSDTIEFCHLSLCVHTTYNVVFLKRSHSHLFYPLILRVHQEAKKVDMVASTIVREIFVYKNFHVLSVCVRKTSLYSRLPRLSGSMDSNSMYGPRFLLLSSAATS